MKTRIIKIGNSQGIILSRQLINQYDFENEVEILAQENGILLKPLKDKPRQKWTEQFENAKAQGDLPEKELLERFNNDFDKNDWTW